MSNDTSGCPTKYLALRAKVVRAIELQQLFVRPLKKLMQKSYPKLLKKVSVTLPSSADPLSKSSLSVDKLLNALCIPIPKCLECSGPTEYKQGAGRYKDFCCRRCTEVSAVTKERIIQANLKKFGVPYSGQDPGVRRKAAASSATVKIFIDPRNKELHRYQGYEGKILEDLVRNPNVDRIFTERGGELPVIEYKAGDRFRRYFPDIGVLLKDGRKILIEVKSAWTLYGKDYLKCNLRKFKQAESLCKRSRTRSFWLALANKSGEILWIKNPYTNRGRFIT